MRIFILCTGRSGSSSFIKACEHIKNYSAGHETLSREIGTQRFNYPDQHIEADNRLSWFLGTLDKNFGQDPLYLHLTRDTSETANSFMKRFDRSIGIIKAFSEGIHMLPVSKLSEKQKLQMCIDYVDTINNNISHFLKDKPNKISIDLSEIKNGFEIFWKQIGAEGNLQAALKEFDIAHNASKSSILDNIKSIFK